VLDEEGWLFKIPVRLTDEAASQLAAAALRLRVAEVQLRAVLEMYRPRQGAPYPEMDAQLGLNADRARELASKFDSQVEGVEQYRVRRLHGF
jgi:hypothetical protein